MTRPGDLSRLLEARAASASPMLIHEGVPRSYAAILDESRRLAAALAALGIGEGDRVAVWMPTAPAWVAMFFACARLGAIAVSVNTRYVARELSDILGRSGCSALLYWPGFPGVDFVSILDGCSPSELPALKSVVRYAEAGDVQRPSSAVWREHAYADLLAHEPKEAVHGGPASPCLIWTTSGTTKAPKFVLHSQQALVDHAFDVTASHNYDADAVLLLAPPLCGAFGLTLTMAAIAAGRPLITAPTWDAAKAARWIDDYGVTHLHGVDDAFAQLLQQNDRTPAFPSIRFCGYGNFNPAQKGIEARADQRGLKLVGMYGTSEIQGLFSRHDPADDLAIRALGGGWPVSSLVRFRVRNPDTGALQAPGEAGELEVLAPTSRMIGYFGDPAATATAFTDDGYYRTGDLGYCGKDGRIFYLGRMGDVFRLGGFLVSAREIEEVVQEVPGIRACQVVDSVVNGAPRAIAFVLQEPAATVRQEDVLAHCRGRLARYKVPAHLIVLDAFPVAEGTNGAKVQKNRLRELAAASVTSPTTGVHP